MGRAVCGNEIVSRTASAVNPISCQISSILANFGLIACCWSVLDNPDLQLSTQIDYIHFSS